MARTVGDVLDSASRTLNDVEQDRYGDPELIGFVNDALNAVKTVRPDLFIGKFGTSISVAARGDELPIDDQFFRPIADYVIARAETKDDEAVVAARAQLMFQLSAGTLK